MAPKVMEERRSKPHIKFTRADGDTQVKQGTPSFRLLAAELALVNTYVELVNEAGLALKGHTLEV